MTDSKDNAQTKSEKLTKLVEEIEKLSVIELNELVKALEEKFGITALPVVAPPPTSAGGMATAGEAKAEEGGQTTFNVALVEVGPNKISVIKAVREINQSLGLKEAKDLVEGKLPVDLLTGVNKETAEAAKKRLEEVGAKAELK